LELAIFFFLKLNAITFAQEFKDNFTFGFWQSIGIISNNEVQFYAWADDSWVIEHHKTLILPNGYEYVFYLDQRAVGVVNNNKVQFYGWGDDSWDLLPYLDLILPDGYSHVFRHHFGIPNRFDIGVVVNDRVHFYALDWDADAWIMLPDLDFVLPNGYDYVFGGHTFSHIWLVGVVIDSKVQFYFYSWRDRSWVKIPYYDLILPSEYKSVFGRYGFGYGGYVLVHDDNCRYGFGFTSRLIRGDGHTQLIGVVIGNRIQFYSREDGAWVIAPKYLVFKRQNNGT